jgi:hypothetical protein
MNNEYLNIDYTPELSIFKFKLKKYKNGTIKLYINNKKYSLKYSLHILRYFYKINKIYKDYNVSYGNGREIYAGLEKIENQYYQSNMKYGLNDSFHKNTYATIKPLYDIIDEEFNMEIFYNNYFKKLTLNQQKIMALMFLGIRITDISRLIETSQPYICIEKKRIFKKIKKLYIKNKNKNPYYRDTQENDSKIILDKS